MTIDEKLGQLGSAWVFDLIDPVSGALNSGAGESLLASGVGHVSRVGGASSMRPHELRTCANEIQRWLVDNTRLGIPAILHEECKSGYMAAGLPVFGASLAMASSFDAGLLERVGTAIGEDMAAGGAHQGLGPCLDVGRDPRWGRIEETYGEDPYLVSLLGTAFTIGLQGGGQVLATAKHFFGHAAPMGGRNANPVSIAQRELFDVHLRPFEHAITEGRAASVMHAYHELDGIPMLASPGLLTDLLRDQMGFDGFVVADYNGIEELVDMHRFAPNLVEAAAASLKAGLDLEVPSTAGYGEPLRQALDQGLVTIDDIDQAVLRVLLAKESVGLFDNPFVEVDTPLTNRSALTYEVARNALVLVQNEGDLLPLDTGTRVALIGPGADDGRLMVGDYAHVVHMELLTDHQQMVGFADALTHAKGCGIVTGDDASIATAAEVADGADVAIVVLAERSGLTIADTCGEARDRVSLDPIGRQQELLEAVAATGTPVVLVVISGRPWSLSWAAEHVASIITTAPPGEAGGWALADALFGKTEPGGRLAVSVPRHVGQVPIHHCRVAGAQTSRWHGDYVDCPSTPLWTFGHGLGYSTCTTSALELSAPTVAVGDTVEARTVVTNPSHRSTRHVAQLYASLSERSVSRPVQELIGAAAVELDAGESAEVTFSFDPTVFAHMGESDRVVVEPGPVELRLGRSAAATDSTASLTVTGETTEVQWSLGSVRTRRIVTC